jgi:hypothetical protein
MITDPVEARTAVVDYLRRQIVGPYGGPDEVIADPPNSRYLMGILFPRSLDFQTQVEQDGEVAEGTGDGPDPEDPESQFADDAAVAATDYMPASQGLSFFTDADTLSVTVDAGRYETLEGEAAREALEGVSGNPPRGQGRGRGPRCWRRHPLRPDVLYLTADSPEKVDVLEGRAELHVRWRAFGGASLVTLSIVNAAVAEEGQELDWDDLLLQVELRVDVPAPNKLLEYPDAGFASTDPEEHELRLQYRHAKTFAVGHGCATVWDLDTQEPQTVRSEVLPLHLVHGVVAAGAGGDLLRLSMHESPETTPNSLVDQLDGFIAAYRSWIRDDNPVPTGTDWARSAAVRIRERLDTACDRMQAGADVLRAGGKPFLAWQLANRAMRLQMRRSEDDLGGTRRSRTDAVPDVVELRDPSWRAFQLAFALTVLPGLVDPAHPDRELVDLIWFPTGGGKTEAYLLLAAFEIFHRRLLDQECGGGTVVVSRYTLSLLTTQQFQRAAATICACEHLRRQDPGTLGTEPITIGLWVGKATTPNSFEAAALALRDLRGMREPDDRFLLERCPWCGTEITPRTGSSNDEDWGILATRSAFRFHCPRVGCRFADELPVRVVDDHLYARPATFLLGTVDKFARLAWEGRARSFFGEGVRWPPSLIIQDELHLLSGPLGTTVGAYEAGIQLLCERDGHPAKVVASTATIRRASQQVLRLFGRDVHLFPPAGVDSRHSFFAEPDESGHGRLFVGVMAQGHTSDTAVVHTGAALVQAPASVDLADGVKDPFWTTIAYHSSLRELGRTVTIARDDIPSRLESIIVDAVPRSFTVEELTANVDRAEQPRLLERMKRPFGSPDVVDFLASTNMLSVGVDVNRLGLMLMNGQPKATAEYIQASSRVGRGKDSPGLVVSLFRSTRPRDRSHYETFVGYHSALYRHVEPTSVTPFSPPSVRRSLHAALVVLARHRGGLTGDDQAGDILTRRAVVEDLAARLGAVAAKAEPREAAAVQAYLADFVQDWFDRADEARIDGKALHYQPQGRSQRNLLRNFYQNAAGWETLQSMRNVDRTCRLRVGTGADS